MFYCNLFNRSNEKLYLNVGSLNKIDSIDIDYENYEMHDIDCLNDHNLYGLSMVNHEIVVPNQNDHQTMMPLGKYSYIYCYVFIGILMKS